MVEGVGGVSPTAAKKREHFTDQLAGWKRQLDIWNGQLDEFPEGTPEGKMLRLLIADGEAWRDHYQTCLDEQFGAV